MYEKLESTQIPNFDIKSQLPRWIHDAALKAAESGERARAEVKDIAGLKRRQQVIREGIERCLGGLPPLDTPLNPRITGVIQGNGFRIEKVIFESRPRVYVTANLYVPDGISGPRGAVMLLCGHREQAKHCDEYQTPCHYLVHSGLVVLAVDPIGQGERFGYYDPVEKHAPMTSVTEHEQVGRQCLPLGDNLARYMLHDAVRAIDYLCSRPEVDPARIGVCGHSGGGTQTSLVMMYDSRIAAAAPGGFIMNRPYFLMTGKAQDAEQKWPGFSALGLDHEDIVMAMAPRPVLILATTYDSVPIEGARHTVDVNRRFWEMHGLSDNLEIYEDDFGHRFTLPLVRAATRFFSKHLVGRPNVPSDEKITLLPAEQLLCTKSGQIIGELERPKNVHQENIERLEEFEKTRLAYPDAVRKQRAMDWLRETVYRGRQSFALNPRLYGGGEVEGMHVWRTVWWSQRGLLNHALQFFDAELAGRKLPVTVAVWDRGTNQLTPHDRWIRETCKSGRIAMVLNPTGIGPLLPHLNSPQDNPFKRFGILDKYTDELMLLGDSMAAVRTYDVLRAVELASNLSNVDPGDIQLYGNGRYAIYAGLAALLEPRVRGVRMDNRMSSIADWIREPFYDETDSQSFILPGMLQYFDLPDLDRWLDEDGRLQESPAGHDPVNAGSDA
ncbi:alpha/beta hydrolase family protein [Paenibacillus alkalitolerans]|uniref:alpha/beta hydrolase family protein n=1 Tax=Paenibacillus alkalitolerans TaxID=2799335 RepID=UPI0018F418DF|nr:acetylxylan esterase [Paenibacillus alkalitolerans]